MPRRVVERGSSPDGVATSTDDLREAADRMGFSGPSAVESWKFRDPGTLLPSGKPAGGIAVDFSGRLYAWQYIQWKWDAGANRYLRFQFGGPHVDAVSGGQLAFASVIVMQAPSQVVDDDGHLIYDQLGTGPATVFTGGQAFEGTWKKQKRDLPNEARSFNKKARDLEQTLTINSAQAKTDRDAQLLRLQRIEREQVQLCLIATCRDQLLGT